MDEEVSIINSNTRNEKIKNFLVNNKNKLILIALAMIFILVSAYSFDKYQSNKKIEISNKYSLTILKNSESNKDITAKKLIEVINEQDPTYSPLSLYFIIDNNLITNQNEINSYFDILIKKTLLDEEIKNLIIYKKALFNADQAQENDLLSILNPLINSESVWKSHALYLMAEFFYSNGQLKKSKEFLNQIVSLENVNPDIRQQAQRRLNKDLSE